MSADDQRQFQLVARAEDRPRKRRVTVRVILVNEADETLLFEDSDPGLPEFRWWVVPGGGMDPGESEQETAIREVAEETGCALTLADLLGPVARRHVVHGYSDQVIEQQESFFVARVASFEVDAAGHTMEEQLTLQQSRWWDRGDLSRTDAWIWPDRLLDLWDLADHPEEWPLELGHQEESTWPDGVTGAPAGSRPSVSRAAAGQDRAAGQL
ncbi:MAG TPA: NUDIX domain-containing protein [Propionibacteriaceae bacterium]|nr:NUDIX domain-containing protein [Propionibacteriaceae bacterium]